jgi:hypothetical protein
MLWDQALSKKNSAEINRINSLRGDAAGILDDRTIPIRLSSTKSFVKDVIETEVEPVGSHHQKVLLVRGGLGLTAFCGGIDINEDRIYDSPANGQKGAPMHDVHCQIEGPAAHDLVDVFVRRWLAHPDHVSIDQEKGRLQGLADRDPRGRSRKGDQFVRIARNFNFVRDPLRSTDSGLGPPWCAGEHSIKPTMLGAIKAARRFIYIEDQYLSNPEAGKALHDALDRVQHVTIVVPHPAIEPLFAPLRAKFIRELMQGPGASKKSADGDKPVCEVLCREDAHFGGTKAMTVRQEDHQEVPFGCNLQIDARRSGLGSCLVISKSLQNRDRNCTTHPAGARARHPGAPVRSL